MLWLYGCLRACLMHERSTHLEHHSGLLQQVGPHVGSDDMEAPVKADLNVLAETTAVVIPCCFGVTNRL